MKFRTFAWFVGPSLVMMALFIALPLASVLVQSFFVTKPVMERVEVETCTPSFTGMSCRTRLQDRPVLDARGQIQTTTAFVGWQSYAQVLEPAAIRKAWAGGGWDSLSNVRFYRALRFTLTFTLVTLPLVLLLGLAIALAVNQALRALRGPLIFVSLLPFIITPVIGALSIRWLFVGDGILTAALEWLTGRDIALMGTGWTIELLMLFYRVWHVAPFAFVIFYAGLQTVNQDSLESAIVDGASRIERLRYVVIPHLMPLILFVALIHLMDAYRVFEEVIGFDAAAYRISLQWNTFDLLQPDESGHRSISRASASAMLTMVGILVLLALPLRRAWREHRGRTG